MPILIIDIDDKGPFKKESTGIDMYVAMAGINLITALLAWNKSENFNPQDAIDRMADFEDITGKSLFPEFAPAMVLAKSAPEMFAPLKTGVLRQIGETVEKYFESL